MNGYFEYEDTVFPSNAEHALTHLGYMRHPGDMTKVEHLAAAQVRALLAIGDGLAGIAEALRGFAAQHKD